MPRMREINSVRKPFMTAMTMISVATPSMMPMKEKPAITEMNASLRRARRYRHATSRSKAENGRLAGAEPDLEPCWLTATSAILPPAFLAQELVDRRVDGHRFAGARFAVLHFDFAARDRTRAGNDLQRNTDQVGGRKFRS